jgi:hypothetical protein
MQGEQSDPEIEHCMRVVTEVLTALEVPASIVTDSQCLQVTMLIARERAIARSFSELPLRQGRPEHLTLAAAERHADWVREASPNLTVVGRLLAVAVDEVRRLRRTALPELALGCKLVSIQFDQWGRPTVKLPDCWRCEEDELCCPAPHSPLRRWICLQCNWEFVHTPVLPEVQVQDA